MLGTVYIYPVLYGWVAGVRFVDLCELFAGMIGDQLNC